MRCVILYQVYKILAFMSTIDSIYVPDEATQYGAGGGEGLIQINGSLPKTSEFYGPHEE